MHTSKISKERLNCKFMGLQHLKRRIFSHNLSAMSQI